MAETIQALREQFGLSDDALDILARWFCHGARSTLRSHEPHTVLTKHRAAFDELVARGYLTEQKFNDLGSVEFTGTALSSHIGKQALSALLTAALKEPSHDH